MVLNIYKWKWIEGAEKLGTKVNLKMTMGVIAQEVQKLKPEAVAVDANGYLMVDYGAI